MLRESYLVMRNAKNSEDLSGCRLVPLLAFSSSVEISLLLLAHQSCYLIVEGIEKVYTLAQAASGTAPEKMAASSDGTILSTRQLQKLTVAEVLVHQILGCSRFLKQFATLFFRLQDEPTSASISQRPLITIRHKPGSRSYS